MENQSPLFQSRNIDQRQVNSQTTNFNMNNGEIDLENWMGNLPDSLTCVPLIYLSIPGSHNSFSYTITPDSDVSPDSPPFVQTLGKHCKLLTNRIVYNWSQGQKEDVIQQLHKGIRYFDVRLVLKNNEIYVSHGLFGETIPKFLKEVNSFLDSHPKEVVIFDFQHFYEFQPEHHDKMMSMLIDIFSNKICHRQRKMRENTLNKLWQLKNQVLIIYRHQVSRYNDVFWPSGTWPTPWPNKIKVGELINYLNKGLTTRKDGMGYVSQGILTPTSKYVALHLFGSLRSMASHTNKKVISWLESKHNGANGVNVVICDFIEKYNFCEKVILLNYKGIEDNQRQYEVNDEGNQFIEGSKF